MLGPLADADELAEAVLRGVARGKAVLVYPRAQWAVVAVMRVAPWLLERVTATVVRRYRADRERDVAPLAPPA
jgi:hypothetical protein